MNMAARTAMTAVLVGVLLGVSGCGARVAGTDGDLVDDWTPMAAAKFDLPKAGMCLDSPSKAPFDPGFARATPIECDRGHTLEVVLVGTVEGSAAQGSEPPAAGSEGFRAAYAACGKAASAYVGGDWYTGMLGIDVQMPTRAPWTGGLRSYVCSIFTMSSAMGVMSFTSGSLKGSLAGNAPKAIRCLEVVGTKGSDGWWDRISALTPIDCGQPHEAEYVGTVSIGAGATGELPAKDVLQKWTTDVCWPVIAGYMGLTSAQFDARDDIGLAWDGMDKNQWDAGDRHQRCFALFSPGKKIHASIRGLGRNPLPA